MRIKGKKKDLGANFFQKAQEELGYQYQGKDTKHLEEIDPLKLFKAIQQFTLGLYFKPFTPSAFLYRGIAKYYLGHKTSALKDINKALELKPEYEAANDWIKIIIESD